MVCSWCGGACFWRVKNWQPSHRWTKESTSDMAVGQKNPCMYVFPTSNLAPAWLPKIHAWLSYKMAHPSSGVMHFIRVSLALRRKSLSFSRVYSLARRRNCLHSSLSSGKPPVLRYIMNGVRQSKWTSMTSGDSYMLSFGGGVSREDSTTLLALAKALEMLGSWSSCKNTPVRTIAWLELSLANSSTT
jgi:hypothetical protein